jgi:hypothetical protein
MNIIKKDVGNTKTTERGGVNQLYVSLNNFILIKHC